MGFLQRVKQFVRALSAELKGLSAADAQFAEGYLSAAEFKLWQSQTTADKYHSLNVAKTAQKAAADEFLNAAETDVLIRAALLHDIGRGKYGTAVNKSIAVILGAVYGAKNRRRKSGGGWMDAYLDVYDNHGAAGAAKLSSLPHEDCGGDVETVAELISRHHDEIIDEDNRLLKILSEADRAN